MNGPESWLLSAVLVFCRVGACFMVMPGLASARVPPRLRLFLAVAVSLSVGPLLREQLRPLLIAIWPVEVMILMAREITIGLTFGLMVRMFFLALHFSAMLMANIVGMAGLITQAIDQDEQSSPFADMVMLIAVLGFFATGQHLEVVISLISSFATLPPGRSVTSDFGIGELTRAASTALRLALEIGAPFIVYAFVSNTLLGLANRWVPQIPVQFIATPIILVGGMSILYLLIGFMSEKFVGTFAAWMSRV